MKKKTQADGFCGICNGLVPETNTNLFYCSEPCRREAWARHHPKEPVPDWDSYIAGLRGKFPWV